MKYAQMTSATGALEVVSDFLQFQRDSLTQEPAAAYQLSIAIDKIGEAMAHVSMADEVFLDELARENHDNAHAPAGNRNPE